MRSTTTAFRSGTDVRSSAGSLAHRLTERYDDVRYRLGAKANPDPAGHIDCSGWTAWVAFRVMDFANAELRRPLFSSSDKRMVNTYSDAQIKSVGDATGYVARNAALGSLTLPLYLIGLNFGDYDWEANANRAYGIDHVVITVASAGGTLLVSQSSSGGGGVNLVPYADWYARVASKPMYGIDLMLLGNWLAERGRGRDRDYVFPDPDTRDAEAG